MRIQVTEDDIYHGMPEDVQFCPVALACKRAGIANPSVCTRTIDDTDPETELAIRAFATPPEIGAWIKRFDRGVDVEPIEFDIEEISLDERLKRFDGEA